MDLYEKISILGPDAKYDTCGPKDLGDTTKIPGVYHAKVGGGVCRLFKVLQTNSCVNNCNYCAIRRDRSCPRVTASPDEMAQAFNSVYSRHLVDGLFLSSGLVNTPSTTMSKMLDTVNILRQKYKYTEYIHLKLMPGTPADCIREAILRVNRVSLNIESPTQDDLSVLSPQKNLKSGFFDTLFSLKREIKNLGLQSKRVPSVTTQFVIGAGAETDENIIQVTDVLYKNFGLARVFFSPFRPVSQTPFEDKPETPMIRAHRLYQADFLMRFYGFKPVDMFFDNFGKLPEVADPKMIWVMRNPGIFPININKAGYWDLLKIPGIGPCSAKKILEKRRCSRINSFSFLFGQRLYIKKLSSYVCF